MKAILLLAGEVWYIINISNHIGESLYTIESINKYCFANSSRSNLLVGYCPELLWGVNKSLTNVLSKLENGEKVAYTETEAHRDVERASILMVRES
jgi:hypothetical protein